MFFTKFNKLIFPRNPSRLKRSQTQVWFYNDVLCSCYVTSYDLCWGSQCNLIDIYTVEYSRLSWRDNIGNIDFLVSIISDGGHRARLSTLQKDYSSQTWIQSLLILTWSTQTITSQCENFSHFRLISHQLTCQKADCFVPLLLIQYIFCLVFFSDVILTYTIL